MLLVFVPCIRILLLLVVVPWGCDFKGCDFKGCDLKGCDCSSLAAFRQGSAAFLAFSGQQARWRCQVGGRHLPTVSYGQSYKQTYSDTGFSRANGLCTLGPHSFSPHSAGRFSSNSCSAALICVFVLREEFAFCFRPFPEVTLLARRR